MKSQLINKVNAAGTIHLSKGLVIKYLQELVIVAQAVTTNVHHPDYMKKEEIVACYEKITGGKFSKSFIKTHKREDFIDLASDTICEELSAYTDEMVEPELKPEEVNEMLVGKEIGFEAPGVVGEDKAAADYPIPVSDLKVSEVKADVNLPLYIKEENCDIEIKSLDKRLLMAQVIKAASGNIVKSFISKGMLLSIINKELFGVESLYKNPAMKVNNQGKFTPAEVALAAKTLDELVSDYLIPHKMGYVVKPYYMAWFYKNANLTYQVKGRSYMINTTRKVIINLTTKRAVPLNKTNCEWLNDGFFVRLAK